MNNCRDQLPKLRWAFQKFQEGHRKNDVELKEMLDEILRESASCFDTLLFLAQESGDYYQSKPSGFSCFILEYFQKWIVINPNLYNILTRAIKEEALILSCGQTNRKITDLFVQIFKINEDDPESFFFIIEDLVHKLNFSTACRLASVLELQERVNLEDFILPLIGQDKVSIVEELVGPSPKLQRLLVQFLDSCLVDKEKLKDMMMERGIPLVQYEKLKSFALAKLVGRLAKKFHVPPECIVNFSERQQTASVRYMAQQCFRERTMGVPNFEELVTAAVKDNQKLQVKTIEILLDHREDHLALKMAKDLNLPENLWPSILKEVSGKGPSTSLVTEEESWETETITAQTRSSSYTSTNSGHRASGADGWGVEWTKAEVVVGRGDFYALDVPIENVVFVDTTEGFDMFLDVLKKESMIGIDAEWRPTFDSSKSPVSLIQIATSSPFIYILDMITLGEILSEDRRVVFVDSFYREDLLVVGFGFREDLKKLNGVFPKIHEKHGASHNLLDMLKLWEHLQKEMPHILPFIKTKASGKDRQKGLSELVRQCWNKFLDKTEQMSDWGRRPLRHSQLVYAALDARVLVNIYSFLFTQCNPDEWKQMIFALIRHKKVKEPKKVKPNAMSDRNPTELTLGRSRGIETRVQNGAAGSYRPKNCENRIGQRPDRPFAYQDWMSGERENPAGQTSAQSQAGNLRRRDGLASDQSGGPSLSVGPGTGRGRALASLIDRTELKPPFYVQRRMESPSLNARFAYEDKIEWADAPIMSPVSSGSDSAALPLVGMGRGRGIWMRPTKHN